MMMKSYGLEPKEKVLFDIILKMRNGANTINQMASRLIVYVDYNLTIMNVYGLVQKMD